MKKIKKNLKWITLILVMIIIVGGIIIKYFLTQNKFEEVSIEEFDLEEVKTEEETKNEEEVLIPKNVYVDIKGAVVNPGVYEIAEDKKVIDLVNLAGGLTEQANTSMINLAKKVFNEMVIIIYTEEEVKNAQKENTIIKIVDKECICPEITNDACLKQENNNEEENEQKNDLININTATLEELLNLSGVGESKAKAIIEYREINGNFKSIEDIINVSGIGESLYEKIKAYITV